MEPFVRVCGIAASLPAANVDTDTIMPKQFLKGIDRSGLRDGLFHDLRFDGMGNERTDFVLNRPATREATFLIVGENFGCGSSREHAVWGLAQFGIRALIGTSFAGIFFDNCARNGLLAISLEASELRVLARRAEERSGLVLTVDLLSRRIELPDRTLAFDIDPMQREALLKGLDPISQTLKWSDSIRAFEARHFAVNPWFGQR